MSQNEQKLLDQLGRFVQVISDGKRRMECGWLEGRIVLSDRRLVLAGNQGRRVIPLSKIDDVGGRYDINQAITRVSDYTSVEFGDQVVLVAPSRNPEEFEHTLFGALLDHETILARHPAVEGGVMQSTDWTPAQIKTEPEVLNVALTDGTFAEIELDDIASLDMENQTVQEEEAKSVLKVKHSADDTNVQTYLSGEERTVDLLHSLLRSGEERSEYGAELDASEEKVLMALQSGVSPFDIPDFVDMDVDRVEEIYERLIEIDALEEVRIRREVDLTARGRRIADGAIEDE